ncbi:hypothetical protein GGR54DRAFT_587761 [Hypoxylon sp. NC1633]|nr:hypothetical protein GGR54DRAFT_587761 [Hypoxylon sp. NC1633]
MTKEAKQRHALGITIYIPQSQCIRTGLPHLSQVILSKTLSKRKMVPRPPTPVMYGFTVVDAKLNLNASAEFVNECLYQVEESAGSEDDRAPPIPKKSHLRASRCTSTNLKEASSATPPKVPPKSVRRRTKTGIDGKPMQLVIAVPDSQGGRSTRLPKSKHFLMTRDRAKNSVTA